MAQGGKDERAARPPGMIVTSITVVDLSPERPAPLRAQPTAFHVPRGGLVVAVALAAALVAMAAIVLTGLLSERSAGPSDADRASELPANERAAIARALGYPYPLRCLTIEVFPDAPDYASSEIDRTSSCARYRGEIYASLHRIDGTWRLMLDEGQLYVDDSRLPAAAPGRVGYPIGCLSAETLLHDPAFASAGADRGVCARPR